MNTGTESTGRPPRDGPSADQVSRDPKSDNGRGYETAGERRLVNLLIAGFILFVLGTALWLGDALLETRRADNCIASGGRNCAPISVPSPPLR